MKSTGRFRLETGPETALSTQVSEGSNTWALRVSEPAVLELPVWITSKKTPSATWINPVAELNPPVTLPYVMTVKVWLLVGR